MEKTLVVILLGPPGVGKGSQATKICSQYKLTHISTGDLFRENIKNQTELGKKAQDIMASGALVPDELVLSMLFDRIEKQDCKTGYLLDGFPRTLAQAQSFDKKLKPTDNLIVISLEASDETVVERISGRLSCKTCNRIYHKIVNPPSQEGLCDHCHETLYQRPDDKEEVVKRRLSVYKTQTKPLIDHYKKLNVLKTISGEHSIDKVFEDISIVLASTTGEKV